MRLISFTVAAILFSLARPALAQEWIEFVSREDGFRVNFPVQPTVTQTTFTSEFGAALPARAFSVVRGAERYSITVADYRGIEQLLTEKAKQCPPWADERCTGFAAGAIVGAGYWRTDIRGALVWASWQFMKGDARVTHYMWNFIDLVEGHQLQITNNDQSRTYVAIYMHDNRLYMLAGTVPAGYPEPALFQQSLGFVDKDGNNIRYSDYYDNDYRAPPLVRGRGASPGAVSGGAAPPGR